jgi:hypothetical protein
MRQSADESDGADGAVGASEVSLHDHLGLAALEDELQGDPGVAQPGVQPGVIDIVDTQPADPRGWCEELAAVLCGGVVVCVLTTLQVCSEAKGGRAAILSKRGMSRVSE